MDKLKELFSKLKELLKDKKVIIGIIVAVVAIIAIIFGIKLFSKEDDLQIARTFDPEKPIVIKKDDKYGYINTKGKVIIEPQYKSANQFSGDFALVSTEDNKYKIINKKGEEQVSSDSIFGIKYISKTDSWIVDGKLYDGNMKQLTKDGVVISYSSSDDGYLTFVDSNKKTMGVMTSEGKITFDMPITEKGYLGIDVSENEYELKDSYCRVTVDNEKYAIINCETGKVIYDLSEKYISVDENNVFAIKEGDYKSDTLETVYIEDDKIAYKVEKELELKYYSEGVLRIEDDSKSYSEKYTYYNLKDKTTSKEKPSVDLPDAWELLTGFTIYECNSKYGLMKDEKVILSCEWEDIEFLGTNLYKYLEKDGKKYILLENDNKVSLYNMKNNKVVVTFNTSRVTDYSNSTFIKYTDKDTDEIVVYNLITDKTVKFEKGTTVSVYSNYITTKKDNKTNYYNVKLEMIYEA